MTISSNSGEMAAAATSGPVWLLRFLLPTAVFSYFPPYGSIKETPALKFLRVLETPH